MFYFLFLVIFAFVFTHKVENDNGLMIRSYIEKLSFCSDVEDIIILFHISSKGKIPKGEREESLSDCSVLRLQLNKFLCISLAANNINL